MGCGGTRGGEAMGVSRGGVSTKHVTCTCNTGFISFIIITHNTPSDRYPGTGKTFLLFIPSTDETISRGHKEPNTEAVS